jgi:uncharacterized protein (TIGR02647 family)
MSGLPELSPEILDELHILMRFNPDCSQQGIKVHHHSAATDTIAATGRLHAKGLITQPDGGYLTSLGHSALEHARALLLILQPRLH